MTQPSQPPAMLDLIGRSPALYDLTPDASAGRWNLFHLAREFDGPDGDETESLIERMNVWAAADADFCSLRLRTEERGPIPTEILLLDGSPSRLPLTGETARVMRAYLARLGLDVGVRVINRREELLARVTHAPQETLVISQAAQRSLYDRSLAEALVRRGTVVVPGPLTAPGGALSNKKITYELLNGVVDEDPSHHLTARYEVVQVDGNGPGATAAAILAASGRLAAAWRETTFFVKPQEGGGGRGCFRIDVLPEGFALPDLSRLGIVPEQPVPLPLPAGFSDDRHVEALHWLARRFAISPATTRAYLRTRRLSGSSAEEDGTWGAHIRRLLDSSRTTLVQRLRDMAAPPERARERLARSIDNYEQLYGVAYRPLICQWIDFGLFSVRAHLRLGREGVVLENLYARLFPVEFTDETIGVVGVDSITNRSEGGMELNRYTPLVSALVGAAGGSGALCEHLENAFRAFARFVRLSPEEERARLPVRAEFDVCPLSGLIAEGNADPVRAQCANTRWRRFCTDCHAWLEDALSYYAWKFPQA